MGVHILNSHFGDVALGNSKGSSRISKFGRNESVGATEVIIATGGIYGLPETAQKVQLASTDAVNDVPNGSGARKIRIFGVGPGWVSQEEEVVMGQQSQLTYLRVFRARVVESGTVTPVGGGNKGAITISQITSGLAMVVIPANEGSTLCACYTVPKGCVALMWYADATTGEGKNAIIRYKLRDNTKTLDPFTSEGIRDSYQNQVGRDITIPNRINEGTDIIFTGKSTASGTPVSTTFLMELIELKVMT